MTIERTFQGAWRLSTIINGHLFTMQYFYYTKQEAIEQFKQYIKRERNV